MKRKMIALLMSALCFAAAIPVVPVMADGQKVVTLGADLSEEQKQSILRYFGVAGQNLKTLTITNQDERNHLGSYVPLEQIGTHTYSCALVSPTTSGGIQVKTANLSWVTSNMIASTLSTSGVVNCEVLAAAPFEVSGTGALTGILMAYESAVGTQLDETKKELATQEMITTTTIANTIGQQQATEIVNDSKMQVIQGNDVTQNDIDVIVNEVAEEKEITLSDEDRELLEQLLEEIAEQDYDYEEMKETLERVEENVNSNIADVPTIPDEGPEAEAPAEENAAVQEETEALEMLPEDSILMNTDESALDGAIFDATDESALDSPADTEIPGTPVIEETEFDITSSDEYMDGTDAAQTEADGAAEGTEVTEAPQTAAEELPEIPEDVQTEGMTEAGDDTVTLNLEMIPLSEFVFAPVTSESTSYKVYPAGISELEISFQRADITAGSGTLSLYNAADSSLVETIPLSDPERMAIVPLNAKELEELGWESGSKAVISLEEPLAQNSSYFVALSQDAFSTQDGIGSSEPTQDSYTWVIQTSWYGLAMEKPADGMTAGSTIPAEVLMDGSGADYAYIENADPAMVSFDQTEFWANGGLNITFLQAGETTFRVVFTTGGEIQEMIDYTVTVK